MNIYKTNNATYFFFRTDFEYITERSTFERKQISFRS